MNHFMKFTGLLLVLLQPLAAFAAEGGASPPAEESAPKKPLPPPQPNGPDNINTYLHLIVNNLTKAEPPRIQDRRLILTWKGDTKPRYVAAAFRHEAYREKHLFWRNQNGVYFLVMDLDNETPANLEYRLIVDGLWQADPTNPRQTRDAQGVALSQVALGSADLPFHDGPSQGSFGQVEFSYRAKPGQQIAIIGNFNQWDPFAHYLDEEHPGQYHLTLALPPGIILYRFVTGTKSFLDPGNARTGSDEQGGTFSYFENKMTAPPTVLEAKMPVKATEHAAPAGEAAAAPAAGH